MSGPFVQAGSPVAVVNGACAPTITGVTAGNTLISCYGVIDAVTIATPTDSAGQTWTIWKQANGNGRAMALAYLFNANAGSHTLTWASLADGSQAQISEWSEFTGSTGGTPQSNNASTGTTITTPSYTPGGASEVIFAFMVQQGTNTNDENACTTAAFQAVGTASDFGGKTCLGIIQNGATTPSGEFNVYVATVGTVVTATWTWLSTAGNASLIAGFPYAAAAPPSPGPLPRNYFLMP